MPNHKQQIAEYKKILLSPTLSSEQLETVMAALLKTTSPEALTLLAEAVADPYSLQVQAVAYEQLQAFNFDRPKPIAAVCAVWQTTRNPKLKTLLQQKNWTANQPLDLKILTHLLNNQLEALDDGSLDFVRVVVPVLRDPDSEIAEKAHRLVRQIKEPNRQALHYFLCGKWQRYEDLDFDQQLMRLNYQVGSESLRRTILEVARTAGRTDFARIITASRNSQDVCKMNPAEFDLLLELLIESQRWDELWNLVQNSSVNYSLKIMQKLAKTNWQPTVPHQQNHFNQLKQLATQLKQNFRPAEKFFQPALQPFLADHRHDYLTGNCPYISYDGRFCIYKNNNSVEFYNLATFETSIIVSQPAIDTNISGDYIVSPSEPVIAYINDHHLTLYNYENHQELWSLELSFYFYMFKFVPIPSKNLLLLFTYSGMYILSCLDGSLLNQLPLQTDKSGNIFVKSAVLSADNKFLATGNSNGSVTIYRTSDWQVVNYVKLNNDNRAILNLALASDNYTLACLTRWSKDIEIVNINEPRVIKRFTNEGGTDAISFSPYGQILLNPNYLSQILRFWQLANWHSVSIQIQIENYVTRYINTRCVFSPDGRKLIIDNGRSMLLCDTRWLRLWEFPLELLTVQDLDYIGQTMTDPQLTEAERTWFLFAKAILEWRMQHDIEIHEATEVVPSQWDIEIEG